MTEEEIRKAKTIEMCITFKELCSNYKYLTEEDYKLLERYKCYKLNKKYK